MKRGQSVSEENYCKNTRTTMHKITCELKRRKKRKTDDSHVFVECEKCTGPVAIPGRGEPMNTEKTQGNIQPDKLCVECKVKPFNPKYKKIKLCGSCLHKKRKAAGKAAGRPVAKPTAPDPTTPDPAPRDLEPIAQPGNFSGTLVTYAPQPHSSAQEVTYKALDLMESLKAAGVDAEMTITIMVP